MKLDVKKCVIAAMIFGMASTSALAFENFKIQKIRYSGLKRISVSTVSNYFELKPGQVLTSKNSSEAIKELYKTGFFQAIELDKQGNVLVVRVIERSTIGSVTLKGNKDISSDQLKAV